MARAAVRYAKALLSLSIDQKTVDTVNGDMALVANTILESTDLSKMLQNPTIASSTKKSVLLEVFKSADKSTHNLIDVLISNNRVNMLGQVALAFNQLFDELKGVKIATVTTAVALTADLEKKVLAKAKELIGTDVEIKNVIDESILGGFIIRIEDVQYNASVANQLNKLKREFTLN